MSSSSAFSSPSRTTPSTQTQTLAIIPSSTCTHLQSHSSDIDSSSARESSAHFTPYRHIARRKRRTSMSKRHSLLRKTTTFIQYNFVLLTTILLISFAIGGVSAKPTTSSTTTHVAIHAQHSVIASTVVSTVPVATASSIPLPRAYDTAFDSSNFTANCSTFFNQFLKDDDFINCQPLSFLLKTSHSWFDTAKQGLIAVTQALDASCGVDVNLCSTAMSTYARSLLDVRNCGNEFKWRNPVVVQAWASFMSYQPLYDAGCLKDSTGYCYASAITNSTDIGNVALYSMPYGTPIPSSSKLTCNSCTKLTMAGYALVAGNKTQPLYDSYAPSAKIVEAICGADFVNATASPLTAGSMMLSPSRWIIHSAVVAVLTFCFIL